MFVCVYVCVFVVVLFMNCVDLVFWFQGKSIVKSRDLNDLRLSLPAKRKTKLSSKSKLVSCLLLGVNCNCYRLCCKDLSFLIVICVCE